MGVLLGLGDALLPQAGGADHLGEQAGEPLRREGHREGKVPAVLGHGDQVEPDASAALEAVEVVEGQGHADLPHPVGAEVEAQQAIPVGQAPLARIADDAGLHELVPHPGLVGVGQGLLHRVPPLAHAREEELVGPLDAVPAVVAIHAVVAAHHRGHPAHAGIAQIALEHLQEGGPRARRRVATVGDGVDQHPVPGQTACGGHLQEAAQVILAGVHPPRADQAQEVQGAAPLPHPVHQAGQRSVLVEAPVPDGVVDPADVLVHDAARPQVEVPHLAVAHEAQGQPDLLARGREQRVRVALQQPVEVGGVGLHGVVVDRLAAAESVQDHQEQRAALHGAASTAPGAVGAAESTARPSPAGGRNAILTAAAAGSREMGSRSLDTGVTGDAR